MDILVKFKIRKAGIYIIFSNTAPFEEILPDFQKKLEEAKKILKTEKTNIFFSGRELSSEEEDNVFSIIENCGINISFYGDEAYIEPVQKELFFSEDSVKELAKDLDIEYDPQNQPTLFQNGSQRSGKRIEYNGSVVLLGDLNAGAEIIASGNIVVLGACRGMVHAGSKGDSNAYIFAQQLTPTQIRIAEMVTYLNIDKNEEQVASYAYISENKIYVAKL